MNYARQQPKEVSLPLRLPLLGLINQRLYDPRTDSRLINGYVEVGEDGAVGISMRPGTAAEYSTGDGQFHAGGLYRNLAVFYRRLESGFRAELFVNGVFFANLYSFAAPPSLPPGRFFRFEDAPTSPDGASVVLFHDGEAAFVYSFSSGVTRLQFNGAPLALTCSLTSGSNVATTASTAALTAYSLVSGPGISPGTFVDSVDSPTQFTLSSPATSTEAAATLTFALGGPTGALNAGVVDLNGAVYLLRGNTLQGSDPFSPRSWNPLNRILAYADQSAGVGVAKQLSYIIVFKTESTEFFRDVGLSPGSPLERVEGLRLDVGCFSGRLFQTIDDAVVWNSNTRSKLRSVWMLRGMKAEEIATPAVRRILENSAPSYSISFSSAGHSFYAFTSLEGQITCVYDLTSKHWSFWRTAGGETFPYQDASASSFVTLIQRGDGTGPGTVDRLTPGLHTDRSVPMTMEIFPPQFDAGARLTKYLNRMYAVVDQASPGVTFQVRVNDQDQASGEWTPWRDFSMSHPRPAIWQCGSFTKRWFHFRLTGGYVRVYAVELDILFGSL